MSIENLISWETKNSLKELFDVDIDLAIREYIKIKLQEENVNRVVLYFKKRKIRNALDSRLSLITSLLAITDHNQLILTIENQFNIGDIIQELDGYYDELVELQGLEALIDEFSL